MTTPIERPNGTDSGKNLLAQILLLLTGMAVHTLGIALITRADLGTTPISTLPLTLSAVMGVTLGTSTFIINIAFFLSQIVGLVPGDALESAFAALAHALHRNAARKHLTSVR